VTISNIKLDVALQESFAGSETTTPGFMAWHWQNEYEFIMMGIARGDGFENSNRF
jgi:hypothetical protein